MADELAWAYLSADDLSAIAVSQSAKRQLFAARLDVNETKAGGLASTELYWRSYQFAVDADFTPKQTSTLISIVKRVHEKSIVEFLTMEESFRHLSHLLCSHSIHRPPYSVGIWSLDQLNIITEWIVSEYYDRYRLYQAICGEKKVLNLGTTDVADCVETRKAIQPLNGAITEDEHQLRLEAERQIEMQRQTERNAIEAEERLQYHLSTLSPETRSAIETYIETKTTKHTDSRCAKEELNE